MSLKNCIKATANLSDEDVGSILEGFSSYKARVTQKKATILAIDDVILSVESERTEFLDLVYKTYPDLGVSRFNESQMDKMFAIEDDTVMVSVDLIEGREGASPADAKDRAAGVMSAAR